MGMFGDSLMTNWLIREKGQRFLSVSYPVNLFMKFLKTIICLCSSNILDSCRND
jgi:hypothetical protein